MIETDETVFDLYSEKFEDISQDLEQPLLDHEDQAPFPSQERHYRLTICVGVFFLMVLVPFVYLASSNNDRPRQCTFQLVVYMGSVVDIPSRQFRRAALHSKGMEGIEPR